MSDVERLRRWFDDGLLMPVLLDAPGTVHLGRAMAVLCGVPGIELDTASTQIAGTIGEADHYVFVLVDGLGMNLIDTLPPDAFLRAHVAMELRSVHPSGTPAGLTSLATGLWPGEHGVVGWYEYLERRDLSLISLPFVERYSHRSLTESGVAGEELFGAPSLLGKMERDVASFVPREINATVYSRYFGGEQAGHGFTRLASAADQVARRIERANRRTYTYLYVPFVDRAQHDHGVFSDQTRRALLRVDRDLGQLAEAASAGTRIVVTADHGQIDLSDADSCELPDGDPMLGLLRAAPSGDPRVPLFHVRPGRHGEFEATFRERFGERFALLTAGEAESLRLLGPAIAARTRDLLGDYVGVPGTASVLRYRPESPMRGYHGGMTEAECSIPLILA